MRAELEQLYCQHRQTLFSLALTVTGCAELAEDAVHEAFVRLCRQNIQPTGSLAAYVFAAVRHAAIDCRRRQARQKALVASLFEDSACRFGDHTNPVAAAEELSHLRRLIDALEEPVREIIVMKTFGNLTFDEIGQVLEMSAATVATRYRRALLKLEEQLRRDA